MQNPITKDGIINQIRTDDRATVWALKRLLARQTTDEIATKTTRERNGRGFNGRDAQFLTDVAQKLPRYKDRMTPRQLGAVRKMLPKYWRQLLEEVELKGRPVEWPDKSVSGEEAPHPLEMRPMAPAAPHHDDEEGSWS